MDNFTIIPIENVSKINKKFGDVEEINGRGGVVILFVSTIQEKRF